MDVNDVCERFTNTLLEIMKQFIPSEEVTIRPNDKPWYDSEIRRLSRHRDRQKAIVIARGCNSDWEKYKVLRNKVNNRIKYAKQWYFSHLEENLCNIRTESPQKYWTHLRNLVNSNQKSESVPIICTNDGNTETLHCTDFEKAECLNEYFASISNKDDSKTDLPNFEAKTNN